MKIYETHLLSNKNYYGVESIKKQIVLGNTSNHDMRHVTGWLNRYNGRNKKTAAFTIDAAGLVYKHFDPKYQSNYFGDLEQDSKSIVILLENEGWVTKNDAENTFISCLGYIYYEENVIEKKWRGYSHWVKYSDSQIESAIALVKKLSKEFYIPLTATTHNTKIDDADDYYGILYKGNIKKYYTDVTPAFDFDKFTNNINQK
jgi:hypothetical protein